MLNLDRRRGQEGNHLGAATVGTPVLELEWRNLILGDWPCGTKSLHNEYWLKHIWKDWDPEDWVTSKHPAFITLPNTYWMFKITCKMRKFYLIQEVMGEQRLSKLDKYIVLFPPIGLIFKNCVLLMFFCVFLPPLLNIFLISSASVRPIPFLSFNMPIFAGNAPLVSLNFLEEISSLSHSIVFLYFFALIHKIHRRTIQKDLHDPDKHDGVITHLEPDILECKVSGP